MNTQPTRMARNSEREFATWDSLPTTQKSQEDDEVGHYVDEFLEGWEMANRGAWKQKVQIVVVASVFLATVAFLGYLAYQVHQFNVLQVIQSLQR